MGDEKTKTKTEPGQAGAYAGRGTADDIQDAQDEKDDGGGDEDDNG